MPLPFSDRQIPSASSRTDVKSEPHCLSSWTLDGGTSPVPICWFSRFNWPFQKTICAPESLTAFPRPCNPSWPSSDCSCLYHCCPHETTAGDNNQWTEWDLVVSHWHPLYKTLVRSTAPCRSSGQQRDASMPLRRVLPATLTHCLFLVALVVIEWADWAALLSSNISLMEWVFLFNLQSSKAVLQGQLRLQGNSLPLVCPCKLLPPGKSQHSPGISLAQENPHLRAAMPFSAEEHTCSRAVCFGEWIFDGKG